MEKEQHLFGTSFIFWSKNIRDFLYIVTKKPLGGNSDHYPETLMLRRELWSLGGNSDPSAETLILRRELWSLGRNSDP